jgi:hypothetical protein
VWEPEPSGTSQMYIDVKALLYASSRNRVGFMFNVCLPSDCPINQEGLPDDILLIFPQLKSSDIRKRNVSFKQSDKRVSMPPVPIFESGIY